MSSYGMPMPNDNKPNANPDGRPLPPGWITEYDNNYRAWFYVNTTVDPPVTTWVHPLVEAPPSNSYYSAPSGPPPDSAYGYDSRQGQYGSGYQPSPPPLQQGYASSPSGYQQQQDNKGLFSSITGGLGRPSSSTQMLPGQTPPPQQSHNTGKLVGVGAAGLVGGVILGEMLEHHKDERHHHHHGGGLLGDFGGGGFGGGPSFGGFGEGHHHHHHEGGPGFGGFGGFGGPGGGPGGGFGGGW